MIINFFKVVILLFTNIAFAQEFTTKNNPASVSIVPPNGVFFVEDKYYFGVKIDLQKGWKMGPKMESKWNQDLEKESPELILDALKASAKNLFQISHGELSGPARDGPVRPGSRAWVPLIKGKHKP